PAPLSALAPAGLRPRRAPGRREVPVRARDGRRRHPGRGRHAVRRVRLAPTGRAGDGTERRARRRGHGMTEARIVTSADGLLRDFNAVGVLAPADVHVARRLTALAGETDESVALAVALAVR